MGIRNVSVSYLEDAEGRMVAFRIGKHAAGFTEVDDSISDAVVVAERNPDEDKPRFEMVFKKKELLDALTLVLKSRAKNVEFEIGDTSCYFKRDEGDLIYQHHCTDELIFDRETLRDLSKALA